MQFDIITDIAAPADRVWATLTDVNRWPEWTESMQSVRHLEHGPLRVGSLVEIRQPGFPKVVWTVTDLAEGRSFTWEARNAGLHSVGIHAVRDRDGASSVTLGIRQTGALAGIMRLLFAKKSRRFVQMEADGLRLRCEGVNNTSPAAGKL